MKINIVGAGLSGLYAGYLLKNEGYDVTIFEAAPMPGGRIRTVRDFAEFPIELGAEFIQGEYSLFFNFMEYLKMPYAAQKGRLYLYSNQKVKNLKKLLKTDKDLKKSIRFFDEQWKYTGEEMSVADYLAKKPWYAKSKSLLDSFGSEFGTDNSRLGMKSLAVSESKWTAGYKSFKLKNGIDATLQEFIDCLGTDIAYRSPVATVFHEEKRPVVILADGSSHPADAVLVTVSLGMLKKRKIQFVPALPPHKTAAIDRLGFDKVVKVFLKFKNRFWKKKMFELYGGTVCPLYYAPWPRQETNDAVLIGYLAGQHAELLADNPNDAADALVKELDMLYGQNVASENLEKYLIMDWSKEEFIGGGYSYDTPFSENMRLALAKPIGKTLFFAGEATDFNGHNSTMQGAMQSAERAIHELMELIPLTNRI